MSSAPPGSASHGRTGKATASSSWLFRVVFIFSVAVAAFSYTVDPFDPVHCPADDLSRESLTAAARTKHLLRGSELVGPVQLLAPEDLIYDAESRVIYTGCDDGWIKTVTVNDSVADTVIRQWVNTGGRPLGLAFGGNGDLLVADANKGLLRVTKEGKIETLADEAEGSKFKLTDALDVAVDGTVYFTDASNIYSIDFYVVDILEGKPHGRFLSYDPATNKTTVLARNLYFANGVAVSPDQTHVIFCESGLRRCTKYFIKGPKKGKFEIFIDDLPGMPDNIHYDGEGHYRIGLFTSLAPNMGRSDKKNGGVLVVDLNGTPKAHYEFGFSLISSGLKIGNHMYCGSFYYPFIVRLDVDENLAPSPA